jgi:large subunit ribosomal protein L1
MSKGKRYTAQMEKIDRDQEYTLEQAVECLLSMDKAKFDETVELAFKLGIDPRQSDQAIRGAIVLPNGTGKEQTVVVIATGDAASAAKEAGADVVGYEDVIERIKNGWLDFDVLVTTPAAMKDIRALGRVLGPRGLMPNPKTGTLTDDTGDAVKQAKAGRVEYRNDRGACVHVPIGRRSFSTEALVQNADAVIQQILQARPAALKGVYLQNVAICSTMSPSIKIDTRTLVKV